MKKIGFECDWCKEDLGSMDVIELDGTLHICEKCFSKTSFKEIKDKISERNRQFGRLFRLVPED